jgi:hypothetical protein
MPPTGPWRASRTTREGKTTNDRREGWVTGARLSRSRPRRGARREWQGGLNFLTVLAPSSPVSAAGGGRSRVVRVLLSVDRMRVRWSLALGLLAGLILGCGSVQTVGGQGGSGGQGTGGSGAGGQGTGGLGTGGLGTGGQGAGGAGTGGRGTGGAGGAGTGGRGTGGAGGRGGAGGHGGAAGGHGGASGGNSGRGGAGGANGGPCWSATDCGAATCAPPGTPLCGGACIGVLHPCTTDSDCAPDAAAPSVCEQVPCSCPAGKGCVAGCTSDGDCPQGQSCASDHHCLPTPCGATSSGCPADFTCNLSGASGGACARKSCQSDAQCSGACVEGLCYGAPGTCRLPLP